MKYRECRKRRITFLMIKRKKCRRIKLWSKQISPLNALIRFMIFKETVSRSSFYVMMILVIMMRFNSKKQRKHMKSLRLTLKCSISIIVKVILRIFLISRLIFRESSQSKNRSQVKLKEQKYFSMTTTWIVQIYQRLKIF